MKEKPKRIKKGGSFSKALRKSLPPIDQLHTVKDNAHILLNNTKQLSDAYRPILGPFADKITNLPCFTASIYASAVCNPLKVVDNSINKLLKVIQKGGTSYKNRYYNYICDPIDKKYYHILSEKGQSIIIGYIGKLVVATPINSNKY